MELKDIAAISGKSGLYRIIKPSRNGVIVESVDETKTRTLAGATNKVSILGEITMYTTDNEGNIALSQVMMNIYQQYGAALPVDAKAEGAALHSFMAKVVPQYDSERVYTSDIKKLVTWYTLLVTHLVELFTAPPAAETAEATEAADENADGSPAAEAKPKKAKVVKTEKPEPINQRVNMPVKPPAQKRPPKKSSS
jgi:hypothetical protein